jgi:crossover junction endodeoxyribonuclease RusA
MARTLKLTLPYPPTANSLYEHGGRLHLTRNQKSYRIAVFAEVFNLHEEPLVGPLRITIVAFRPDKRKRDLDNLLKPTLDALQHAHVYADDSQIEMIKIYWSRLAPEKPGVLHVTILELGRCLNVK